MSTKEKSKKQQKFESDRADFTERDIQMEILYSNWAIQNATEKTRSNTLAIFWIIAIIFIISIIAAISQYA